MGYDTKGVVITEHKDVRDIATRIINVIRGIKGVSPTENSKINPNSFITCDYNPINNYLKYNFLDGEDPGMLFVFLDCDSDNQDLGDKKISLILVSWGDRLNLMTLFLESLKDLGPCYVDENDCDDSGWTKLN